GKAREVVGENFALGGAVAESLGRAKGKLLRRCDEDLAARRWAFRPYDKLFRWRPVALPREGGGPQAGGDDNCSCPRRPGSPVEEPQDDAEHGADQQRCRERDVKPEVLAFDDDIAGQTAKAYPGDQRPEQPGSQQRQTENDKELGNRHVLLRPRKHIWQA